MNSENRSKGVGPDHGQIRNCKMQKYFLFRSRRPSMRLKRSVKNSVGADQRIPE